MINLVSFQYLFVIMVPVTVQELEPFQLLFIKSTYIPKQDEIILTEVMEMV